MTLLEIIFLIVIVLLVIWLCVVAEKRGDAELKSCGLAFDRDRWKNFASTLEARVVELDKQVIDLTKGDANGEVGRDSEGHFTSKKVRDDRNGT